MSNAIRTVLIIVVATVWAANFIAPIFVEGYIPPEGVHVAFMALVGILTAGYDKGEKKPADSTRKRKGRGGLWTP